MNLAVGLWSLGNKCNNRLPGRRSDHVILARLIKAGATNAYPFLVAAATVDTDHRYQPSLRRLKQLRNGSPRIKCRCGGREFRCGEERRANE